MPRVMQALDLFILVRAVIVFRRTRDQSAIDSPSSGVGSVASSGPVWASALSHGGLHPLVGLLHRVER